MELNQARFYGQASADSDKVLRVSLPNPLHGVEMAHEVTITLSKNIEVSSSDLTIKVKQNGLRLGTLYLSKGGIVWRPAKKWSGGPSEIPKSWGRFDELLQSNAR